MPSVCKGLRLELCDPDGQILYGFIYQKEGEVLPELKEEAALRTAGHRAITAEAEISSSVLVVRDIGKSWGTGL